MNSEVVREIKQTDIELKISKKYFTNKSYI